MLTRAGSLQAQWFSGILGYIIPRKSNEDEDDEGDEQGLPIASSTESSMNEIALPTAPMVLAGPPRSAPQKLAERGMQARIYSHTSCYTVTDCSLHLDGSRIATTPHSRSFRPTFHSCEPN